MSRNEWTDEGIAEWNRIRRKVDGLRVTGMPCTNSKDAISIGPPPASAAGAITDPDEWAWLKLTSILPGHGSGYTTTGGGALYGAALLTGTPVTVDPTKELLVPGFPKEVLGPADAVIAANILEANAGDPPSHWIQLPCFAVGKRISTSNENPPRSIYRVWVPPQVVTGKITGNYAYGGPGLSAIGAARYKLAIGTGRAQNISGNSNFQPPDANMVFPGSPNAIWVNLFEGGSAASGTAAVATGAIVTGFYVGQDSSDPSLPVFYGSSAPTGTLFIVNLASDGTGTLGNSTSASSWKYNVTTFYGSLTIASSLSPQRPRAVGTFAAATLGTAFIGSTGAIVLAEAWEIQGTTGCL